MTGAAYERLADALAPYVGLSDAAAADALNAATVTRPKPLQAGAIKKLWGRWAVLGLAWVKAGDTALPTGVRAVCRSTYDNLMGDLFADIDMSDPAAAADATGFLDALVAAGVLTEAQRAATLALGSETVSPATVAGWPPVTAADVAHARSIAHG